MELDNNTIEREQHMDQPGEHEMHVKPKRLKLIYKLLIGAGMALLASGLGLIFPIIRIITLLAVVLCVMVGLITYGTSDIEGAAAFMIVFELCQVLLGGIVEGAVVLLAVVIPLALMIYLDIKRLPFFKRMYISLGIELAGMVLALGFIVLIYRENIGDLTVKMLKDTFARLGQGTKDMFITYYSQFYTVMGMPLTYETGDELLNAVAESTGEYIQLGLPGMLIILAAINVLPGVRIYSGIRVNRNLPGETVEPLAKWRLSEQAIIGLILVVITGLILNWTIGPAGEVVYLTALMLGLAACTVQTLASLADRFFSAPINRGMKIVFAVALILLFVQAVPFYGMLSMLIGSHGLITQWLKRRNSNRQDPDEPF